MPKPSETATLTVKGTDYTDWESVTVIHAYGTVPPYLFRFTCSEPTPLGSKGRAIMQIVPGDDCTIALAGILAFTGKVGKREVFYDARRHHILIEGGSLIELSTGGVTSPDKTGEWKKGTTFQKIAQDVVQSYGKKLTFVGQPPNFKFPFAVRKNPGESPYNFLDRISRSMSTSDQTGIHFGSNPQGDFVIITAAEGGGDSFVEGVNILTARELIYSPELMEGKDGGGGMKELHSQAPTDDKTNMTKAGHEANSSQEMSGNAQSEFGTGGGETHTEGGPR